MEAFSQRSGTGHGCPSSAHSFNMVLEILARAFRQEKEIKCIKPERKKEKSLFSDDTILYVENP